MVITLVLLGFVLNIVAGKTSTTTATTADGEIAVPAPRPVAPLFVPRSADLIIAQYGGSLSADASPQDVARAFALSYYQYDPDRNTPATFADALPRLGETARQRLPEQLPKHWAEFLIKASRTGTVEATTRDAEQAKAKPDRTTVAVSLVDNPAQGPKPVEGPLRMDIDLEKLDKTGWTVTSVNLAWG
ncbi:hypothetical protein [Streptomyces sp. Isolate_45]|uniref:hypothetical protein n=1 Tax=Streptomyces sp. Isolate_45 TaxID=2950111 RepID=UPI002481D2F3|nr:hypothetical protein [Streptomyces sp. Isolate_45]MDA5282539.1 hypothetical protein [Streptomyces sp. Isolate_45]